MVRSDLNAAAFPELDDAQMAAIGDCAGASLERYAAGQRLIGVGARGFKFFIVKSGEIEVVDPFWTWQKKLLVGAAAAVGGTVCAFKCSSERGPLQQAPPPSIP